MVVEWDVEYFWEDSREDRRADYPPALFMKGQAATRGCERDTTLAAEGMWSHGTQWDDRKFKEKGIMMTGYPEFGRI